MAEGGLRTKGVLKSQGKTLVTIVTVVFNCEKYLRQTIDSILSQDYDNVEYVIVDGASTDGTVDIISEFDDKLDYWVSEPDKGISDAFSKGIGLATGDIIGLVNGDDWLEPGAITEVVRCFSDSENNSSDGGNNSIDGGNKFNGSEYGKSVDILCGALQYWDKDEKDYIFYSNIAGLTREMTINHPATFVRAGVYEKYGAFDSFYKVAMDYDFIYRCFSKGVSFGETTVILSNMRLDGNSDLLWIGGFADVRDVKIKYGQNFLFAWMYYFFQITRKLASRFLTFIGLSKVVDIFRNNFSVMKKEQ